MQQAPAFVATHRYNQFGTSDVKAWLTRCQRPNSKPAAIAVDPISLDGAEAEVFGLLEANSSGKSSLLRLISTLLLTD